METHGILLQSLLHFAVNPLSQQAQFGYCITLQGRFNETCRESIHKKFTHDCMVYSTASYRGME
jgi:hypothetical protein